MSSVQERVRRVNRIPLAIKIIILAQVAIILAFTVGMYQEYLSNLYLQAYVLSLFSTNIVADLMLSVVTVSVFAIGTFTLLGSMSTSRGTSKKWGVFSESAEEGMEMPAMPVLETITKAPKRKTRSTRRSPPRQPIISNDDLFASMIRRGDERKG